jgi:HTH-type transcriptional regulator / antitoxin HipB
MSYPLRIPEQLKPHLRALRKSRGVTQADLGALVGVKQARIAEIEANPGAVSLDQLVKVLAALGATLQLHAVETDDAADLRAPAKTSSRAAAAAATTKAAGAGVRSPPAGKPALEPARKQSKPSKAAAPRAAVVIPAKKGVW